MEAKNAGATFFELEEVLNFIEKKVSAFLT
jgi:hypothetical protein